MLTFFALSLFHGFFLLASVKVVFGMSWGAETRALVPVVEGAVPEEALHDCQQVLANLQLAYAAATEEPQA